MKSESSPLRRAPLAAGISLALASGLTQAATFNVTTNADSGAGSLRDAIAQANGAAGPHTIDMTGISGDTITLASSLTDITEAVDIIGSDVTLDGAGAYSCLYAYESNLGVSDLTVTGCTGHYYSGNTYGGGIEVFGGTLTMTNSTVTSNTATYGGGVFVTGDAEVTDSVISDNTAVGGVGGISGSASLTLVGSQITGNTTGGFGGGFRCSSTDGCALSITDSEITGNSADYGGGGYVNVKYTAQALNIDSSTISNNNAGNTGGGVHVRTKYEALDNTIVNSTITGNSASLGGGVYIYNEYYYYDGYYGSLGDTSFNITGSTISLNDSSSSPGGGILASNPSAGYGYSLITNIGNTIVEGNTAASSSADLDLLEVLFINSESMALERAQRFLNSHRNISPAMEAEILDRVSSRFPRDVGNGTTGGGTTTFNVDFSLVGEAPAAAGTTFNPDAATSSVLGQSAQLGPLANNGGPTQTHLPAAGSPAIDLIPSGDNGCGGTFNVDQRGEPRPETGGTACDAGAVETGEGGTGIPETTPVPTLNRWTTGLLALGLGLMGWFGLRRRNSVKME